MKILQVITRSDLGGAQSVLTGIANKLCEENDVMVVAGTGDDKFWRLLDARIKCMSIKCLHRNFSLFNDIIAMCKLLVIYFQFKPDIIHLHSSKIGIIGRLVFPSNKIIYTVHGFDSIRLAYRYFLPLERLMQSRCKAIVGVCRYDQKNMIEEGITHNVKYIYNGIYDFSHEIAPVLNIDEKYKKKILCIARISKQKRFDVFLSIAKLMKDYAFIWVGNQNDMLDLPENVYCLGSLTNASFYNNIADLFILPSNYEGLPIVIIEAMSAGLPIVASNVGGINEIVVDNYNGYTVDNVPELFVQKIDYILKNEDVYRKLSNNSIEFFKNELIIDKMVDEYLKLYLS